MCMYMFSFGANVKIKKLLAAKHDIVNCTSKVSSYMDVGKEGSELQLKSGGSKP